MLGNEHKLSWVSKHVGAKSNRPLLAALLIAVFFVLTRRRPDEDEGSGVVDTARDVRKVAEMDSATASAWKALADKQRSLLFPCSEHSNETYSLANPISSFSSSDALWSMMSSEASKQGKMATIAIESPCIRFRKDGSNKDQPRVHLRTPSTDVDVYLQVFKQHFLRLLYPLAMQLQETTEAKKRTTIDIEYILDGGANCGMTTLLLASLFPSATIVSVEPDPSNALVLRKNTAHLPNVHVVEAGLWDVTGKIALKGNHGQWGRVFQRVDDDDPSGMLAYSVSHIMRKFDIPRFDLVKMDIEGSEAVVLGGEDVRWLQDVKVLFAEVHDMFAGYFGLSQERQEVTEIVERVVFSKMKGAVRTEDNEHVVYFSPGVVEGV